MLSEVSESFPGAGALKDSLFSRTRAAEKPANVSRRCLPGALAGFRADWMCLLLVRLEMNVSAPILRLPDTPTPGPPGCEVRGHPALVKNRKKIRKRVFQDWLFESESVLGNCENVILAYRSFLFTEKQ